MVTGFLVTILLSRSIVPDPVSIHSRNKSINNSIPFIFLFCYLSSFFSSSSPIVFVPFTPFYILPLSFLIFLSSTVLLFHPTISSPHPHLSVECQGIPSSVYHSATPVESRPECTSSEKNKKENYCYYIFQYSHEVITWNQIYVINYYYYFKHLGDNGIF